MKNGGNDGIETIKRLPFLSWVTNYKNIRPLPKYFPEIFPQMIREMKR
jgi:hypothetical protein